MEKEIKKDSPTTISQLAKDWEEGFNAIPDIIFIIDCSQNIISINQAAANALNAKKEDVVGKKCFEIIHKVTALCPDCPLEKTNQDKQIHTQELNAPAGIRLPLLVTTTPIFNKQNDYLGVVHIAKDISERKIIEEELKKKIADLERFQRLAVDRELRMKELKAKIAELETKNRRES